MGEPSAPTAVPAATAAPSGALIPALTPVRLEIRQELISKISKPHTNAPQSSLPFSGFRTPTLQNCAASSLSLQGYGAALGSCRSSETLDMP